MAQSIGVAHWRFDSGLMERICTHGIGHPDPDHMAHLQRLVSGRIATQEYVDAEAVHGCDGCCRGAYYDARSEQVSR